MKIVRIATLAVVVFMTTAALSQTKEKKMETNRIEAKTLYDAFKQGKEEGLARRPGGESQPYKKKMTISGIATYVGPDVYALPSVELWERLRVGDGTSGMAKDVKGRILCVLPFSDYLKLRKVSKKDHVVMEGNVLGFADEYDIVVVKQCKIIEINGKKE